MRASFLLGLMRVYHKGGKMSSPGCKFFAWEGEMKGNGRGNERK